MADLNFRIAATLDNAGFTQAAAALRGVGVGADAATVGLEGVETAAEGVSTALNAFAGLVVIQFLRDIVDETAKAETQQLQLKTRVESTGLSFAQAGPQINSFLEGVQNLTHVSKEELIPAFEQLITRTHSVRDAQELLTTTVGVARGANMGLVEAADLVAGVMNNQSRAILQATKMLGLHKGAATDSKTIMKDLTSTFGSMAESVSAATAIQGDLTAKFQETKIELGTGLMPVIGLLGDLVLRVFNFILGTARFTFDGVVAIVLKAISSIIYPLTFFSTTAKAAFKSIQDATDSFAGSAVDAGNVIRSAFQKTADAHADISKGMVDVTKKTYDELNEAQKTAIAEGLAASQAGDLAKYNSAMALLNKKAAAEKKALRDSAADQLLSEKDMAALLGSVDNEMLAKRLALKAQYDKAESDQTKNLLTSQVALTVDGSQAQLQAKLKLLDATTAAERQQANDSLLDAKQHAVAMQVIDNNSTAARAALYKTYYQKTVDLADSAATEIGTAMGNMLAGQSSTWRSSLANILKMIINYGVTAIEANYAIGASVSVATQGWVGVAEGAGLLAAGAAAAAVVGNMLTDPSSSPSTISSSAASSTISASPTAAAAAPTTTSAAAGMTVIIQGDMLGDNAVADRLAARINDAVLNRDVRLVATQLNTAPNRVTNT